MREAPSQPEFSFIPEATFTAIPNRPGEFHVRVRNVPTTGEEALYLSTCAAELGISLRSVQRLCHLWDTEPGQGLRSYRPCPKAEHRRVKRAWLQEYKIRIGMI